MFGLSFTEIFFILLICFLIFGPEQFPIMLKKAYKLFAQVKGYITEAQTSFQTIVQDIEKDVNPMNWDANKDIDSIKKELELVKEGKIFEAKKLREKNKNYSKHSVLNQIEKNLLEVEEEEYLDMNRVSYSKKAIYTDEYFWYESADRKQFKKEPILINNDNV